MSRALISGPVASGFSTVGASGLAATNFTRIGADGVATTGNPYLTKAFSFGFGTQYMSARGSTL